MNWTGRQLVRDGSGHALSYTICFRSGQLGPLLKPSTYSDLISQDCTSLVTLT